MIRNHKDEKCNIILDILNAKEDKKLRFMPLYRDYLTRLRKSMNYLDLEKNKKGKKIKNIKKFTPSKKEFSNLLKKMIENKYLIKVVVVAYKC